ncbi:MAG TPA: hypothetical protein VEZ11_01780, partial [Thermoanaerobaculia bacterium]|nr:hypothetical protein [Thermoanaerobaculia bacterium]
MSFFWFLVSSFWFLLSMLAPLLRLFPDLADLPPGTYAVGGVVRDLLLGRPPADADLACCDPLACAESLARKRRRKVIRLGKDVLTAYRVVAGRHVYDFAAIQGDGIAADLSRRDFTINAMAIDLGSGALLDPFDGARDIERRVIRMIRAGNFDDDPLRLLKAARMAMTTGFSIDDATLAAIRERASAIESIAAERAGDELAIMFSQQRLRQALTLLVAP